MLIDTKYLKIVNQILERDSKDTTYKFALLKATIESIKLQDQFTFIKNQRAHLPTGLIVEKWLFYYYPLYASNQFLPQKHGESPLMEKGKKLAFRDELFDLIHEYKSKGGLRKFYQEYKSGKCNDNVNTLLIALTKKMEETITKMPMRYLGKSYSSNEYSIFKKESKRKIRSGIQIVPSTLYSEFGSFSIPQEIYSILKYMGSYMDGTNSIDQRWAEFVIRANREYAPNKEFVLKKLWEKPFSERDVAHVKKYFDRRTNLFCVWSDKKLSQSNMHIDHLIPYSVYFNNDIWNLLPAHSKINGMKSDKIPSPDLIEKRKHRILEYWNELQLHFKSSFENEFNLSLFGKSPEMISDEKRVNALKEKANYFIEVNGSEAWEGRV